MAMSSELEGLLAHWLPRQIWFPATTAELAGGPDVVPMSDTQVFEIDVPDAHSEVVTVQGWIAIVAVGSGETTRRVSVPLTLRTVEDEPMRPHLIGIIDDFMLGRCYVYDAAHDPIFVLFAAHAMAQGTTSSRVGHSEHSQLTAAAVGDGGDEFAELSNIGVLWHRATTTRLKVDSSANGETTVFIDDHAFPSVLTYFRVLDIAPGGDIPESVRLPIRLTNAGSPAVAPVLGWMAARWFDGTELTTQSAPVAMLTRSEPSITTAWADAVEAALSCHDGPVGGYAKRAGELGGRVAQFHIDISREFGTVEGSGEPTQELVDKWAQRVSWALKRAPLALNPLEKKLLEHKRALTRIPTVGSLQRIHGGLILNHINKAPVAGFTVSNFPDTSDPRPPAIDLVALLRSIDYAGGYAYLARTGQLEVGAEPSTLGATGLVDKDIIRQVNTAPETRWSQESQKALLAGYSHVAGATFGLADPVLRAALVDRLLVEIVTELRNRPTWLIVPLAELTRVLSAKVKVAREPARFNPRTSTAHTRAGIDERLEAHRAAQAKKIAHVRALAAQARAHQAALDRASTRHTGSTRLNRADYVTAHTDTAGETSTPPHQPKPARDVR